MYSRVGLRLKKSGPSYCLLKDLPLTLSFLRCRVVIA